MVKSAEELDGTNVENYSAIFIGGGNTYKLLNDLKASGSFEKIKDISNRTALFSVEVQARLSLDMISKAVRLWIRIKWG